MAKRNSLNRRSSRSSRYTGSAILDPDTDVVDNTHSNWWKNLENNTIARPSIDYNMLSETTRRLDSNSQVETSEAVDGWWKVLETSSSSKDIEDNIKKDAPENVLLTSESEEEPRIRKRKLPLRSKTKTPQNNAFFNVLNDIEETPTSGLILEPLQKTRKKSSTTNYELNNDTATNKEQLAAVQDSSLNQSSSSNNILKSKPKSLRKATKNRSKNIFIDVLQNNEFKVPLSKTSSIGESKKIIEQKNSSILQAPVDNQSELTECTLSFENTNNFSHFPAPKAQSTILEDNTSYNSSKNDSTSDTEHKIVKRKPKLLKRTAQSIKKNVFENIFTAEESEEVERSTLTNKNVEENIEVPKRSLVSLPNDLPTISQRSQKSVINEDENNGTEMSYSRKKRKSAILAEQNIKNSIEDEFVDKNIITTNDSTPYSSSKSDIEHKIVKRKPKLLKRIARSTKKNVFENIFMAEESEEEEVDRSTLTNKNVEENIEVPKRSVVSSSNDLPTISQRSQKSVINEDENTGTEMSYSRKKRKSAIVAEQNIKNSIEDEFVDKNIVLAKDMSDDSVASSAIPKLPRISLTVGRNDLKEPTNMNINTSNQSLSSSDNNIKQTNAQRISKAHQNIINDKNVPEIYKNVAKDLNDKSKSVDKKQKNISQEISILNALSSFSGKDRRNTKNLSRSLHRTSNLVSSVKENENVDIITSNVNDNYEKEAEEVSNDSSDEELIDPNFVPSFSIRQPDSEKNSSRSSFRNSHLTSPVKRSQNMDADALNVNDEDTRFEDSNDISKAETINQFRYIDKNASTLHRKSADVSSSNEKRHNNTVNRSRLSQRASNIALSAKKIENKDTNTINVYDKNIREEESKDSSDSTDDELASRFPRLSQRRSVANVSSSINNKKRNNTKNRDKVSSRASRLQLSVKEITQINSSIRNFGDKGVTETEDEALCNVSYKETPKTSQYTDKEQENISQRRSVANISSGVNKHKLDQTENRSTLSSRSNNRRTNSLSVNNKKAWEMEEAFNRLEQERPLANVSSSINRKEHSNIENPGNVSRRTSNIVLSTIGSTQMNIQVSNVGDKDARELEISQQQPDENVNPFQRKSGINVLSTLNRKEQDNVENGSRASSIPDFFKLPTNRGTSGSKGQLRITNFFDWSKLTSTPKKNLLFDEQKAEKIKEELEKIKKQEMDNANTNSKQRGAKSSMEMKNINGQKTSVKKKRKRTVPKQVHKAYLVNGNAYKVPRLPRPKLWITDRLYNHLWKVMEPKFKLETRVISEKFVRQLSEVTASIAKQKWYNHYRGELSALMKEMARLGIIRTRNDFYNFCHDFFPYELRVKMVPMLLPGNKRNIPYDPSTLHEPLLGP